MEKALIVYISSADAYKIKKRPDIAKEALKELNEHLSCGWSVKHSASLGTGNELGACNLVILEKSDSQ